MGTFGSGIKSVQRGTVTIDADPDTVTITAVVLAKSFLVMSTSGSGGDPRSVPRGTITDTTTLTFDGVSSIIGAKVAWEVVEYY